MSTMNAAHAGNAIDLDRYAEVMAHLRHFPADKHAEVVARLGIRRRDWEAAAEKWKRARDAERAGGKTELSARFGRVMVETRAKLEAALPPLESIGRLPGPDWALDDAPPHAGVRSAPSPQPASALATEPRDHEVPTFLHIAPPRIELPAPVAASSPRDLAGTADPDTRAIMAALARGPLPFAHPEAQSPPVEAPTEVDLVQLPLETYASVTGALARGEPREQVLGRHKVSAETFERLAKAWAPRFQREPHLLARFKELAKGGA